jgi:ADP-dependent NAD(P)H-hydrate dehydratase / NAD(P)H-hydrate epimerase
MFGHALMVAGSYGKMGAAVLATKACLAGGAGLVTCYLPACGYQIMQIAVPEAMVTTDSSEEELANLPDNIEKYSVIGMGPGIGTKDTTRHLVSFLIRRYQKPMVIDADGLNCLALQPELLTQLPGGSILTPHPKEFDRLFGNQSDDFKRMEKAIEKAQELNVVILVKGHHTIIAAPDGTCYFNSTGNAGMAKGGSGDVLTGLISALVAQHYTPLTAAILGVYLHGLSGDLAAKALSMESMLASDLIHHISEAFLQLY